MSLSVQTNIEAFDAHRNLLNTSNQLSESMQKLFSIILTGRRFAGAF